MIIHRERTVRGEYNGKLTRIVSTRKGKGDAMWYISLKMILLVRICLKGRSPSKSL